MRTRLAIPVLLAVVVAALMLALGRWSTQGVNPPRDGTPRVESPQPAPAVVATIGPQMGALAREATVQGQVVDIITGTAVAATMTTSQGAQKLGLRGLFSCTASELAEAVFSSPGYEDAHAPGDAVGQFVIVKLRTRVLATFQHADGRPAAGARVYGVTRTRGGNDGRPVSSFLGVVDATGSCTGITQGMLVWAEDGLLVANPRVVSDSTCQVTLDLEGVPLSTVMDESAGDLPEEVMQAVGVRFEVEVDSVGYEHSVLITALPKLLPRKPIRFMKGVGGAIWLDALATIARSRTQNPDALVDDAQFLKMPRPAEVQGIVLVLVSTGGPWVYLKGATSGTPVPASRAELEIYGIADGKLRLRKVAYPNDGTGAVWWAGNLVPLPAEGVRVRVVFKAPSHTEVAVENPTVSLQNGATILLVPSCEMARVAVRRSDGRADALPVRVLEHESRSEVWSGAAVDSIEFGYTGVRRLVVQVVGRDLEVALDAQLAGSIAIPALGTASIVVPDGVSEDLVLWGKESLHERSFSEEAQSGRRVVFDGVPAGVYDMTPRDRYLSIAENGGDCTPTVEIASSAPTEVPWDPRFATAAIRGSVIGSVNLQAGEDLYVWPFFGGDKELPSYRLRGPAHRVNADMSYAFPCSGTAIGMYCLLRKPLGPDVVLAYSRNLTRVAATVFELEILTPQDAGGFVSATAQVGPLVRDGGALGGLWTNVDPSGTTRVANVPAGITAVTWRRRSADGTMKTKSYSSFGSAGGRITVDAR